MEKLRIAFKIFIFKSKFLDSKKKEKRTFQPLFDELKKVKIISLRKKFINKFSQFLIILYKWIYSSSYSIYRTIYLNFLPTEISTNGRRKKKKEKGTSGKKRS